MFLQLLKLQWFKTMRSVSLGRTVIGGIIMAFFGLLILINILVLGLGLKSIIIQTTGRYDVTLVIDNYLIFFFLLEMMYRFFLQKLTAFELDHYLHLPIGRPKIIHSLLLRSFISPFNLVVILLFGPFYWTEVRGVYGFSALFWFLTIIGLSWSIHWLMIWFKQKFGDSVVGILILFVVFLGGLGSAWYGWFNIGRWTEAFFTASLHSVVPFLGVIIFGAALYGLTFSYYKKHAYLEELGSQRKNRFYGNSLSFFNRFGAAGTIADLELKLILRHKKSRSYLIIAALFLAYGLVFYINGSEYGLDSGKIPMVAIFIGTFITGIFMIYYGQFFLSWNAPNFDFFLSRKKGIQALVKGKYMVIFAISLLAFLLSTPYVYFGWNILFIHGAAFLFNMGVNMYVIIYLSLWKPKPMDLNKRSMFNMEGIGAAQFLMAIPVLGLPYITYFLFSLLFGPIIAIIGLAVCGLTGIINNKKIIKLLVNQILKNKYAISSSFRGEI